MKTNTENNLSEWSSDKARYTYGIGKQASEFEYFDISENGDLLLNLENGQISISEITQKVKNNGLSSFVLRIPELIKNQLDKLYNSFQKAIEKHNYTNFYQGVFPVKVNQTYSAINSIYEYGKKYNHGFEVGTKPELLIAVSQIDSIDETLIISNGTKDRDYLEACLVLQKNGYNLIISIESITELDLIIELKDNYDIIPSIGLRIKILQEVEGHWGHSSGLYSKFGFSGNKLKEIITKIEKNNLKRAIKLIHGHIGSQISDKSYFSNATSELIGIYIELKNNGFRDLEYLNLGGGLGIDYSGNRENKYSGTSYSFDDYALTIISKIKEILKDYPQIPEPIIVTESGRAISAHYSLLLIEILEKRELAENIWEKDLILENKDLISTWEEFTEEFKEIKNLDSLSQQILKFEENLGRLTSKSEFWLNFKFRNELENVKINLGKMVRDKFKILALLNDGQPSLSFDTFSKYKSITKHIITSETYLLGNFSVFNGACDVVLVDQYFPILPIQHLNERPHTLIKTIDITCDSDGELGKFISPNRKGLFESWNHEDFFTADNHLFRISNDSTQLKGIPFPKSSLNKGNFVLVGLTGAYQSTVYFDQNLLGRIPEIALAFNENSGEYELSTLREVELSIDLLPKMNHDSSEILKNLPKHPIFESLLYSSPYINSTTKKNLLELFSSQNQSIIFPFVREETLVNIATENELFED